MRKLVCSLLLLLFASAFGTSAGELAGKWSGSFDITDSNGETKADTAYMELKADNGQVTGTAGPNADKQWPLQNGKLNGNKLTFEVRSEEGGLLSFDLSFDGDEIQGSCAGTNDDGEKMSAKLHLKRVSN